ncbi:uncharacterized protein LOC135622029 [Musa acuminata AAA Group]|uniref:uncharacterized protein LOC135622029 n=1 Tax=Musa acuminata AAA Group TaxID=214697 RepID=UPI0031D1B9E2
MCAAQPKAGSTGVASVAVVRGPACSRLTAGGAGSPRAAAPAAVAPASETPPKGRSPGGTAPPAEAAAPERGAHPQRLRCQRACRLQARAVPSPRCTSRHQQGGGDDNIEKGKGH